MKFSRENVKFMKFTNKKRETHVIQKTMKREAWNARKRSVKFMKLLIILESRKSEVRRGRSSGTRET
jgi:hypothetical protein